MTDPTILDDAANGVLAALVSGATDSGWILEQDCVTAVEPAAPSCDSIFVWPAGISVTHVKPSCQIVSRARFGFFIAACIGAEVSETCDFWDSVTPGHLDKVWGTWVGLVDAILSGTVCPGVSCSDVTLRDLNPVASADIGLWRGEVEIALSPVALGS